jgi:hypothetical protein
MSKYVDFKFFFPQDIAIYFFNPKKPLVGFANLFLVAKLKSFNTKEKQCDHLYHTVYLILNAYSSQTLHSKFWYGNHKKPIFHGIIVFAHKCLINV